MADTELAVQRLRELKELGVRLALDDFGTGYSSLSYLSRFPVDILKMDRSFLRDGATPEAHGLATAVVALGATLSLEVVAEGIELVRAVADAARPRLRPRPGLPIRAPDGRRRDARVPDASTSRQPRSARRCTIATRRWTAPAA